MIKKNQFVPVVMVLSLAWRYGPGPSSPLTTEKAIAN